MTEQQRHYLIAAEMFLETAFGQGDDSWKEIPHFAGMNQSDMAWCAHGLIQYALQGSESSQLSKALEVLAKMEALGDE